MSIVVRQDIQTRILKIWFDGERLYGLGDDSKTYRQSLLWYEYLLHATESSVRNMKSAR